MTTAHLWDALRVVRDALVIPYAATVGGEEIRDQILIHRLRHAVVFLERILDEDHPVPDLAWSIAYLRERLAEHPPVGYVTGEQAHQALARGLSWSEAVAAPTREEGSR
jgi:hypothetical protein